MIKFDHERVTMLRESKGLSVVEFAKKLNLHKKYIYQWEKAVHTPSVPKLVEIANTFGCPIEYFFPKVRYQTNNKKKALA